MVYYQYTSKGRIEYKNRDEFLKEHYSSPGCPQCDGYERLEIRWGYIHRISWSHPLGQPELKTFSEYKTGPDEEEIKYKKYILFKEDLGNFKHYVCSVCNRDWVLHDDGFRMSYLESNVFKKIRELQIGPVRIKENLINTLGQIGATPPDSYGNGRNSVDIPCEVTTIDGTVYPKAMVSFLNVPQISKGLSFYANIIDKVRPSRYAVTEEVRQSYWHLSEARMGFFPTPVKKINNHYKTFTLNGRVSFFDADNVTGEQLELLKTHDLSAKVIQTEEDEDIVYFYATWIDGVDCLRLTEKPKHFLDN